MSEQQSRDDLKPKPNSIMAEPATVAACAGDLRTPRQRARAAGEAVAHRGSIVPGRSC